MTETTTSFEDWKHCPDCGLVYFNRGPSVMCFGPKCKENPRAYLRPIPATMPEPPKSQRDLRAEEVALIINRIDTNENKRKEIVELVEKHISEQNNEASVGRAYIEGNDDCGAGQGRGES